MQNNCQNFYEKWAEEEFRNPLRKVIMDWNAHCLFRLYQNNQFKIERVAEIGGAEGHVLGGFLQRIGYPVDSYNFELSQVFIDFGKEVYKNINFMKIDITKDAIEYKFDLIILSDIIEHIENDEYFLESCAEITNYILIKLPLENTLHTKILRKIGKLSDLGVAHPSGHLHDYNIETGINLIKKQFEIIDFFCEDMPFNLRSSENLTILGKIDNRLIRRLCYYLPGHIYSKFYDSSLFVLAKSKRISNDMN